MLALLELLQTRLDFLDLGGVALVGGIVELRHELRGWSADWRARLRSETHTI